MSIIPKVSIVMATYNRAHFILETLRSIINQSFTDWECLIIDDGGTDNTEEVIALFLEQYSRFKYTKRPEGYIKGLSGCRNYGLDLAKGEYVIFFDDDDFIHPENLKIGLEVIETNNVDFCNYQKLSFEVQKPTIKNYPITIVKSLNKTDIKKVVTQEIGLASCTVLWKKKCFTSIRFNETLLYAEEWECYSRVILENFKGLIISNVLYYNRKHPDSNTGEFYRNNADRRESYTKAILLVIRNLKEKQLLSPSLIRYFVTISKDFVEYELFKAVLSVLELPIFEKLKWQLFHWTLPLRLSLYKRKKQLKRYN
ncbi:glycosyltransferase family 2 protein [Flavobacterium sp. XS2P39]|uniref:glycosyltransferase family 2 protein n=1 Tax=Flavobacterium sp. XS2P39 TaxID=3401725 RepID=UPI003AAC2339